jgi:hypothetical protein
VPSDEDVSGCGLRDLDPLVRGLSLIVCLSWTQQLFPSRGMEVGTEACRIWVPSPLRGQAFPMWSAAC